MINRVAIILRYKAPAIKWINDADPGVDNPGITAARVNEENTVYLVSDTEGESKESAIEWVKLNFDMLFEEELEGWYTVPSLWPKNRTWKLFNQWFGIEFHSCIIDTAEEPIIDDDI